MVLDPKWVPRSAATHASLCNTVSTDKPKTVNFVTVKSLTITKPVFSVISLLVQERDILYTFIHLK